MELTAKEKLFCYYYFKRGSARQAAVLAGYSESSAAVQGARMMQKQEITSYIKKLGETIPNAAKAGLERIAAGPNNDAIGLVLHGGEITPENLQTLDLVGISEIKRLKDGTFEIKFFDRIKAFSQLAEIYGTEQDNKTSKDFFDVLNNSAKLIEGSETGEDLQEEANRE
ncbi:MAG: terminase small subunit [Oscillospiraceae bacterium]|nr:terminase small subunit [Oscillospiraceae bacterium]